MESVKMLETSIKRKLLHESSVATNLKITSHLNNLFKMLGNLG